MENKIVLHFLDQRLVKGITSDFFPNKAEFHVSDKDTGEIRDVQVSDLKGIFFVKSFEGDPAHKGQQDSERTGLGKRVKVQFKDGETLIGYTSGYSPGRVGFFVFPADPDSNNEKIFVVVSATEKVEFL